MAHFKAIARSLQEKVMALETEVQELRAQNQNLVLEPLYYQALKASLSPFEIGVSQGNMSAFPIDVVFCQQSARNFGFDEEEGFQLEADWFNVADQHTDNALLLSIEENPEKPFQTYQMLKRYRSKQGVEFLGQLFS